MLAGDGDSPKALLIPQFLHPELLNPLTLLLLDTGDWYCKCPSVSLASWDKEHT
jgi:hypothetical protein